MQLFYPPDPGGVNNFFPRPINFFSTKKFYRFSSGLSFSPFFRRGPLYRVGGLNGLRFYGEPWIMNLEFRFQLSHSTYFFTQSKLSSYGELIFGTTPWKREELENKAKNIKYSIISCVTWQKFRSILTALRASNMLCCCVLSVNCVKGKPECSLSAMYGNCWKLLTIPVYGCGEFEDGFRKIQLRFFFSIVVCSSVFIYFTLALAIRSNLTITQPLQWRKLQQAPGCCWM